LRANEFRQIFRKRFFGRNFESQLEFRDANDVFACRQGIEGFFERRQQFRLPVISQPFANPERRRSRVDANEPALLPDPVR
jgi:hypothetical protein